MVEETILDSSGSTIELIYDVDNDIVKIKKLLVDEDFREVKRLNTFNPNIVIGLETPNDDDDGWLDYTDQAARSRVRQFWETNKVNKD